MAICLQMVVSIGFSKSFCRKWLEINKRPFTTGCSGFQVCFILHIRHVTVLKISPRFVGERIPNFHLRIFFNFWAVQPKIELLGSSIFHSFLRDRSLRSYEIIERPRRHQQDLINSMLSRDPTKRPGTLEPKSWGGNRWRAELDSVGKLWKVSGNPKSLTIWRIHRNDKISCDGHCFLGHVNFLFVFVFCLCFFAFFFFFRVFVVSSSWKVKGVFFRNSWNLHLKALGPLGLNHVSIWGMVIRKKYPGTTGNMSDLYKSS